jgi:hypothetical protein
MMEFVKVSWDDEIPNIWKVVKHVPHHQPEPYPLLQSRVTQKYCLQLVDASHSFTHLRISVIIEACEVHIMQQNCDAIGGPGEPKQ